MNISEAQLRRLNRRRDPVLNAALLGLVLLVMFGTAFACGFLWERSLKRPVQIEVCGPSRNV